MDLETSKAQGHSNEKIEDFINQIQDTQHRVVLIKIKSNNSETHEAGRCFKQCLIGRASDNDYVVNDKACSRQHCLIYFKQDRLCIRDLFTKSGTFVNGVRIAAFEDFYLLEKDVIQINDDSMIVQHIDNVKVVEPVLAKSFTCDSITAPDQACPYCSKQTYQLVENIEKLKSSMQKLVEKIRVQQTEQTTINSVIESSLQHVKELERQQKIVFVEQKTPSFKTKSKLNETKQDKSLKTSLQTHDDGALRIEDIVTEQEPVKKSLFNFFKSKKPSEYKAPEEATNAENVVQDKQNEELLEKTEPKMQKSKGWFGRSKHVTIESEVQPQEPKEAAPVLEQSTTKSKGLFSFFKKSQVPANKIDDAPAGTENPAEVVDQSVVNSKKTTKESNDKSVVQKDDKTADTEAAAVQEPAKKSSVGFFSKIFGKSKISDSKLDLQQTDLVMEKNVYEFDNDERIE